MHSPSNDVSISIIVPVYRSEELLWALFNRTAKTLNLTGMTWEIIFVDDNSPDNSWEILNQIYESVENVRIIHLAHNHGQQFATLCGLTRAKGKYTFTIDDDLQCHPEDIPHFLSKIDAGFHVVIGKIVPTNKQHALWRNWGSRINSTVIEKILSKPPSLALSSYRCFSQTALHNITSYRGAHPHIAALALKSIPHKYITNVEIQHSPRGGSHPTTYTFAKLLKTASYIIVNHSYLPLRIAIIWGALLSCMSILFALTVLIKATFFSSPIAGWASIAVLVSFLSGNILLGMGIIGEYVGRLVEENTRSNQFMIFEEKEKNICVQP